MKTYTVEIAEVRKLKFEGNKEEISILKNETETSTCKLHKKVHTDFDQALIDPCLE